MPKPGALERPEIKEGGASSLRISWTIPEVEPEVSNCTIKVRVAGSQRWQNYDFTTSKLVLKGGSVVPAPTCEVTLEGVEEGLAYEAVVAAMNSEGWGELSQPSSPGHTGELKPREKPPKPGPPKLTGMGPGRMRCTWVVPRACPPVEASQVEVHDMTNNRKFLVEAASGKLVTSGRTTFAASRLECTVLAEEGVEYEAAVCCRNAEGFGEYSMASDSTVAGAGGSDAGGMMLVMHEGPTAEVPIMEPTEDGKLKVRWLLPEDAKSTTVKLRRTGDQNWYLCGGTAIKAPAQETIATGLEVGIEYEAVVSFLINGKWGVASEVSKPACIGQKKLPSIPGTPKEPSVYKLDVNQGKMTVRWKYFPAVPQLTGAVVKFRKLGGMTWQYVSPLTGEVLDSEPKDAVMAPASEVEVTGLSAGIRYEACVAFRNKLGTGPDSGPSEVACLGRPLPNMAHCQYCFNDFDIQHSDVLINEDPGAWWCPPCRFRAMDPFNSIVEPYGLMICHIVVRPVIEFSVDLRDLKNWRKEDHDVFLRMVKIGSDNCSQAWPRKLLLEANGNEVINIKEPEEGHVRRDVPKNIVAGLRPGLNTIKITMDDEYLSGYAFGLVRTTPKTAAMIATETPRVDEEASMARVMSLLADTWDQNIDDVDLDRPEDEELSVMISNKLKLRCPLSFEKTVIPVRGEECRHLQCFGLGAYLESNMKMRSMNNRWTCPVCSNVLKPEDLRIDSFVERVLAETADHIEEVLIMQDGSYKVIEEDGSVRGPAQAEAKTAADEVAVGEVDDDGQVTELPMTIGDEDENKNKRKANTISKAAKQPLRKRRARRIREAHGENVDDEVKEVSDNDSD